MSLPETYRSGLHMARVLSSYIDCPHRVQHEVRSSFFDAPGIPAIKAMRAAHLKPRHDANPACPHEGYWPDEASRQAESANRAFVQSLVSEGMHS